jgi:anti-sigma factor RsiW
MTHLTEEQIARVVDGEADEPHLRDCAQCAGAALDAMQWKRAVREAAPRYEAPEGLRARISGGQPVFHWKWLVAAAAAIAIVAVLVIARVRAVEPMRELVDLHATLLAGANAVDVISTDRHTVKPWFEGRVPFAVPVPDLPPPFRLIGGRVVYWHQQPGAYLLIGKGAHRISLFIFRDDLRAVKPVDVTSEVWRANGLTFVAIADVPSTDLAALRRLFT